VGIARKRVRTTQYQLGNPGQRSIIPPGTFLRFWVFLFSPKTG